MSNLIQMGPVDASLPADPLEWSRLSTQELFSLPWSVVEQAQRKAMIERCGQLRSTVPVLDRLIKDADVGAVEDFHDIVPLLFPHTMFKSYPISFIEKGRYKDLTLWLDKFTTHDLSRADVSGANSLDSWLDLLEAQTPVRPVCSSGTSGKISFIPRSITERPYQGFGLIRSLHPWGDELGIDLSDPEGVPPFLTTWPSIGRFSVADFIRMLWDTCYRAHPERVFARGDAISTDMLSFAGRLRTAEAQGKTQELTLTPALKALKDQLIESQKRQAAQGERFFEEIIERYHGQRVIYFTGLAQIWGLYQYCQRKGITPGFASNSLVIGGGGKKGLSLPDDWKSRLLEILPPLQDLYGMSELNGGNSRLCAHNHFHFTPWVIMYVVDPETGMPLPRQGIQTGRFGAFDLFAKTHWGGLLSGDRVTVNWDDGCPCGRQGPYLGNDIERYANIKGDDKITCMKVTDAYEKAVDFAVGLG